MKRVTDRSKALPRDTTLVLADLADQLPNLLISISPPLSKHSHEMCFTAAAERAIPGGARVRLDNSFPCLANVSLLVLFSVR